MDFVETRDAYLCVNNHKYAGPGNCPICHTPFRAIYSQEKKMRLPKGTVPNPNWQIDTSGQD